MRGSRAASYHGHAMGNSRGGALKRGTGVLCLLALGASACGRPPNPGAGTTETQAGSDAGRRYPERAYFGDQHVHTAWSADAGAAGITLGPEEAVRFARVHLAHLVHAPAMSASAVDSRGGHRVEVGLAHRAA